jgi:hypothetical protein
MNVLVRDDLFPIITYWVLYFVLAARSMGILYLLLLCNFFIFLFFMFFTFLLF